MRLTVWVVALMFDLIVGILASFISLVYAVLLAQNIATEPINSLLDSHAGAKLVLNGENKDDAHLTRMDRLMLPLLFAGVSALEKTPYMFVLFAVLLTIFSTFTAAFVGMIINRRGLMIPMIVAQFLLWVATVSYYTYFDFDYLSIVMISLQVIVVLVAGLAYNDLAKKKENHTKSAAVRLEATVTAKPVKSGDSSRPLSDYTPGRKSDSQTLSGAHTESGADTEMQAAKDREKMKKRQRKSATVKASDVDNTRETKIDVPDSESNATNQTVQSEVPRRQRNITESPKKSADYDNVSGRARKSEKPKRGRHKSSKGARKGEADKMDSKPSEANEYEEMNDSSKRNGQPLAAVAKQSCQSNTRVTENMPYDNLDVMEEAEAEQDAADRLKRERPSESRTRAASKKPSVIQKQSEKRRNKASVPDDGDSNKERKPNPKPIPMVQSVKRKPLKNGASPLKPSPGLTPTPKSEKTQSGSRGRGSKEKKPEGSGMGCEQTQDSQSRKVEHAANLRKEAYNCIKETSSKSKTKSRTDSDHKKS